MAFDKLPGEIILEIRDFLDTNSDLATLRALSRYYRGLLDFYGYVRNISIASDGSAMNFVMLRQFNLKALRYLSMESLSAPQDWITCEWPETTRFRLCYINSTLSPPKGSRTTSLHLEDVTTNRRPLIVDWSKLPDLKKVYIATDALVVNLEGLLNCKKLEVVILDLSKLKTIPETLFSLPQLKVIISNVGPPDDKEIHVKSEKLEKCMVPKKMKFICQSKIVPRRHITDNVTINVRSIVGDYMC